MKKILLVAVVGLSALLAGCGDDPEPMTQQQFELKKLQMEQQHELDMAKAVNQQTQQPVQDTVYSTPSEQVQYQQGYDSAPPPAEESSGLGSAALGAVAGLAAGYAMSELLDDGWRSYTNNSGQTVYYDRSGRQVNKGAYDSYKRKNPTRHKISSYNQRGKTFVNTAKSKTVSGYNKAATKVKQKSSYFKQKVSKPKSYSSSRSSYRSSSRSNRR